MKRNLSYEHRRTQLLMIYYFDQVSKDTVITGFNLNKTWDCTFETFLFVLKDNLPEGTNI